MSSSKHHDRFATIASNQLDKVSGGAARVTARSSSSNDQLTLMMTQITDSIKALAQNNNNQNDPMQMMMMMMMMGGLGGGGGGSVAAAPAPQPQPQPQPVINISTSVRGRHGW